MVHITYAYLYTTYHLLLYPCLWPHSTTGLITNRSYQQVKLPEIHNNRWKCNTNRWYTTSLLATLIIVGIHMHIYSYASSMCILLPYIYRKSTQFTQTWCSNTSYIYIQLKVNIIYTTLNCNEDHAWWYRIASVYHYVIGFSVIDF